MVKMTVQNANDVLLKLNKITPEVFAAVSQGIKESTFMMEGEVKESISGNRAEPKRVDTGRYRGSVKAVIVSPIEGNVESNVSYGKFLEYGTTKLAPGMHFRNSLARNKSKIIKYMKDKIKQA